MLVCISYSDRTSPSLLRAVSPGPDNQVFVTHIKALEGKSRKKQGGRCFSKRKLSKIVRKYRSM
jgi:hypothetical protein